MVDDAEAQTIRVTNRRRGGVAGVVLRALVALGVAGGVAAAVAVLAVYAWFARDLPRLDRFDDLTDPGVTRFEAGDGQLVGEWSRERRIRVRWDQLPRRLVLAFLAAEDARFFQHGGVDLRGVVRAMIANLRAGSIREGASTLSQQLAKQLVGAERSYTRKIREAILARRMEDLYTKQQILTWYLNAIYLGHGSYGVQAAAQNYFRKDVWDLSLAEMAMLGGLPQAPSRVNPVVDPAGAHARMAHVLEQMARRGWITEAERAEAAATELVVHPIRDTLGDHVPYYTEQVRKDVSARYQPEGEDASWLDRGLTVSLAVEPAHQVLAARALGEALEALQRKQGFPGPLGRLERDVFLSRARRWLPPGGAPKGTRLLARAAEVAKDRATLELSEALAGTLPLEAASWAGPYTELPVDAKGRRDTDASVSFQPRLEDLRQALAPGDVVLVEVTGGEGRALELALVPVPLPEGAIVSAPLHGAGVDTLVGGWDFDRSQVQRAYATRQTGSTMKPIVYGKAYDLGLPPSALFSGAPFREGGYNPTGARTKDDMLVWNALAKSENSVSLRVLQYVLNHTTLADYQAWGRALGLPFPLQGNTSEVLGMDQTPLGMMEAFAVLALRGQAPHLPLVRRIVDREGRVLERHVHPLDPHASLSDAWIALWSQAVAPPERRIDATTAYLLTANLREVVAQGTATRARKLEHEAYGKTGTLPYDVWFDGFTGHRVATVWVGADRRERPLGRSERVNKVYGGDTALPAWTAFMAGLDRGRPVVDLREHPPDDVVFLRIDPETGLLRRSGGVVIPHRKGTEPTAFAYDEADPQTVHEVETDF